ncbi:host specificity factor TipJ family phage tail protein [Acinetobacter baumannii]|uniref:host specificity factor TipJ family phage tail protein n=1 Tax=Acinetobacter baumannii TaxID=470 RepID=UPI001EFE7B27|nr:host specificity factor TipJ family phage tail protein [Acinetobacter baumannii]MCG9247029.1 host specificity factor TipJ family phage tail protein [Acinetobacter baumannii]MCG9268693.1 host specificity factor TipJ family phage tail protein [Acinetobacter baumannii]
MSLKKVIIVPDVYDRSTWSEADVEDVLAYIYQQFDVWPENAKIYHNQIAESSDVTPNHPKRINAQLEHIQTLEGKFFVVIEPAEPISLAMWVFYAIVAATTAYSLYTVLTMPKPQAPVAGSSNNELAQRSNQARLNARIPDIFGKVRSYPDLIAQTYTIYKDGIEIEECLMCIGRGYFQILDMRDGDTDVANIAGTSVSVYDPFTSIVGTPIYQVGESFTELPKFVRTSASINGQTIELPNKAVLESSNVWFQSPNLIKGTGLDFTQYFAATDRVALSGAVYGFQDVNLSGSIMVNEDKMVIIESTTNIDNPNLFKGLQLTGALVEISTNVRDLSGQYVVSGVTKTVISGGFHYEITLSNPESVNANWSYVDNSYTITAGALLNRNANSITLDDTYTINSVTADTIALVNPSAINSDWDKLLTLPNQSTQGQEVLVRFDAVSSKYVGWFNFDMTEATQAVFNFFFPNGLFYQDSKGGVWEEKITVIIELQAIDSNGDPVGSITTINQEIRANNKSQFGKTIYIDLPTAGSFRFRLSRTTATQAGKTQDTCKIKSVYGMADSTISDYGNVTVLRSRTVATDGALSIKERKLNCLVNRKLPLDGTGPLQVTRSAGQALINLALDDHIGRRTSAEVDIAQINAEIAKINAYFGSDLMSEFNYTIDDDNLSFEEIAGMVASAAFCEPYRFGSLTRLKFEQPQENAVLLFNHRNKVPLTEKRSYTFGVQKDYDGVELEYTSDVDDARVKYIIPEDITPKNPLKITTTGIRNEAQAKVRAWREWNKLRYKYMSCELEVLDESELLIRNDRILVADNTLVDTQDGEVESVDGLIIQTSQPCTFDVGSDYFIHLQISNATVDVVPCTAGVDKYHVVLSRPPVQPLVVSDDRYVKTLYTLVRADQTEAQAFMLEELTPQTQMTNTLKASNYDARFYERDHDFI